MMRTFYTHTSCRSRAGVGVAIALFVVICAGCGEREMSMTGAVTFDGQPIDEGSIVFEPADCKGATTGGRFEQGRYSIPSQEGVSPGAKIVRITAVRKTGRQFESGPPAPAGTMIDEIEIYLPHAYNRESILTCEIDAGTNEQDFRMESQPE